MKSLRYLTLSLLLLTGILLTPQAHARAPGGALNGTPNLYVLDGSPYPIIYLAAVNHGFFSSTKTNLLAQTGGMLMPHQRAFIHFPSCVVDIQVMTTTHIGHTFPNVNVCLGTYWTIPVF